MAVLVNPYQFAAALPEGDSYLTPWFPTDEGGSGNSPGASTGFNAGSFALSIPPKAMVGDILCLFIETVNGEAATVSAGWTEAPDSPIDASDCRLTVFWRRMQAGDTSVTINDSGNHQVATMIPVRGCIETGDPWHVTNSNSGSMASNLLTINGATTTENNCLVVMAAATGEDSSSQFPDSWANGDLTNVSSFRRAGEVGISMGSVACTTGEMVTAGTFGNTTVGYTNATGYAGWVGALLPTAIPVVAVANIGSPFGSTGSTSVSLPEHKENDILVAFVETANQAVTVSGFTEAGSSPASATGTRLTVFWKRAASDAESNPALSDSGDHQNAFAVAIRNAITSGDPFNVTNSSTGGTGTSISIVGATTTEDGCLVLAAAGTSKDAAVTNATFSGWTNSDLSQLSEIMDRTTSSGNGGGFGVAAGYKDTAGAYGATSVTQDTSVEYTTWTGAIRAQ